MKRLVALFLVAAALCLTASAAARPSEGWRTHRSASGSFSIGTPASWIDFTRATPRALELITVYPQLRPYLELARAQKRIKLVLASPTGPTVAHGYATNLNVVQIPVLADLELVRRASVAELKGLRLVVGQVHVSHVRLPASRAVRLVYHARYRLGGPLVAVTQFLLVHHAQETVLTYTTLPVAESTYRATFDRSARSLRFL
jgi:hypothetical protein